MSLKPRKTATTNREIGGRSPTGGRTSAGKERSSTSGRTSGGGRSNAMPVSSAGEVQKFISNLARQADSDYTVNKFKADFKSAIERPPSLSEINFFLTAKPRSEIIYGYDDDDDDDDDNDDDDDDEAEEEPTAENQLALLKALSAKSNGTSFYCDECSTAIGAVETRYMCTQCNRTDFCEGCHNKMWFSCTQPHHHSHRLIELKHSDASFLFSDVVLAGMAVSSRCDECGKIICNDKSTAYHGIYHCTVCDNFDLCLDCVKDPLLLRCPQHDDDHPMMFVPSNR